MAGKYYARKKTSLNKERVLPDKAFERSRAAASVLGIGSKIASQVYRKLKREQRKQVCIGKTSGRANRLLQRENKKRSGAAADESVRSN